MIVKIRTKFGSYIVDIPENNLHRFYLNEYSEEIVECYK